MAIVVHFRKSWMFFDMKPRPNALQIPAVTLTNRNCTRHRQAPIQLWPCLQGLLCSPGLGKRTALCFLYQIFDTEVTVL